MPLKSNKYKYLYVVTEHGKFPVTGGIGSYTEEIQKLCPEEVLVLVCIKHNYTSRNGRDWLILNDFFDDEMTESIELLILVARAIQIIINQYPSLQKIEIQEYLGIAAFLLHLQRNQLFPTNIPIFIHCHGAARYIENNNGGALKPQKINQVYAEKVAIDLSRNLRFPTKFLYESYLKFDYNVDPDKVIFNRYPFNYPKFQSIKYATIDTLIFFGKRNAMKGYKEFARAIQIVTEQTFFLSKIKKIVLLGPDFGYQEENDFFRKLNARLIIEEMSVSREKSLAYIRDNANHALCVLPYRGNNHPLSILEVVSCQCPIIAANAGGIPELIPASFHDKVLFDLSPDAIVDKIEAYLKLTSNQIEQITTAIFLEMRHDQETINENQFMFPDLSIQAEKEVIAPVALAKYEIKIIKDVIGVNEFLIQIVASQHDYVVFSKIELKAAYADNIISYINENKLIEAGILAANPLYYKTQYPMLGEGLPALFLNQNYILSKVLYVKKSRLIEIVSTLNQETKIDAYFLIKLLVALKKRNCIVGVVYINEEEAVFREELLNNDSYGLLSILSEIGLNKFDSDRILKLTAFNASNQNSLLNAKNQKDKSSMPFQIKHKLLHVVSRISKNNE